MNDDQGSPPPPANTRRGGGGKGGGIKSIPPPPLSLSLKWKEGKKTPSQHPPREMDGGWGGGRGVGGVPGGFVRDIFRTLQQGAHRYFPHPAEKAEKVLISL